MNNIKITDEYVYERISVDVIQEIKHFNYNGVEGEYIKERTQYMELTSILIMEI